VNGDRPSHAIYLETETGAIPRPNSCWGFRREAAKPSPFTVVCRYVNTWVKRIPTSAAHKLIFVGYKV
jgi:hypothetical protein